MISFKCCLRVHISYTHTKKNQRILFYINEVPINSSTKTKMIIEMFIPNLFPYFKNSAVKHHYYLVNILSNL